MPTKMTRWHFFISKNEVENQRKKNCQFSLDGTISENFLKYK
ncbi:MAG: hypothetical protein P8P88_04670 [Polaribacter sp.]|nr:hypothetical protein [Polaribacter sp.]